MCTLVIVVQIVVTSSFPVAHSFSAGPIFEIAGDVVCLKVFL